MPVEARIKHINEKKILVNPNTRVCGWGELAFFGGGGVSRENGGRLF